MLSKEEKLKYGEILRQQVLTANQDERERRKKKDGRSI
jgi:hypothetical protein